MKTETDEGSRVAMTQSKAEHTPTPWKVSRGGCANIGHHEIAADNYAFWIAEVGAPHEDKKLAEANAAYIVECVNAHAELQARVALLEQRLAVADAYFVEAASLKVSQAERVAELEAALEARERQIAEAKGILSAWLAPQGQKGEVANG